MTQSLHGQRLKTKCHGNRSDVLTHRLRDVAGLPRDLVLYLARHECGTRICRLKGIEYARRLLGHTDI